MSTAHVLENGPVMVTKGAVDVLLNRVTKIQKGTEVCQITQEDKEAIENQNQEFQEVVCEYLRLHINRFKKIRCCS